MKWPWVSRAELEADMREALYRLRRQEAGWLARAETAEEALAIERARVDRLTDQLLGMKRQGFEPQPITPPYEPAAGLPSEVTAAIAKTAPRGSPLYRSLSAFAESQHALGIAPDLIARHITKGANLDELEDLGSELPTEDDGA